MTDIGINSTHAVLAFIFGVVIVAITAIEAYFGVIRSDTGLLFVASQNVGLGLANSFYVSQLTLNASGITEKTSVAQTNP